MSAPLLEAEGLFLNLGGREILKGVCLSLNKGEFICVIGPNGAAKSTLVKCIDGIHAHYRGKICWNGVDARSMPRREIARHVAYVPQGGMDHITYTVGEFLEMARYPWRDAFSPPGSADRSAVAEALELAGVSAYVRRRMDTLSGGERQNVLIASALAQGSSLLLLDEPTTYLDYRHQQETLSLVRRINQERGVAVLAVTHDINFALHVADRVIALQDGAVFWEGKPTDLLEKDRLELIFGVPFRLFHASGEPVPYVAPCEVLR